MRKRRPKETPVEWDADVHVGNEVGTTKHFIASKTGKVGASSDGGVYFVATIERDDIPWLIEALQRELKLVQAREN